MQMDSGEFKFGKSKSMHNQSIRFGHDSGRFQNGKSIKSPAKGDDDSESDDLAIHERINVQGRIIEVPDELLESSKFGLPEMSQVMSNVLDIEGSVRQRESGKKPNFPGSGNKGIRSEHSLF